MSGRYTPLKIWEQIQIPKEAEEKVKDQDPLIQEFMSGNYQQLDLDDFLNWVLGDTFCKTRYDGPYSELNELLLRVYHQKDAPKGSTYKECRDAYRKICCIRGIVTCWNTHKQAYRFDPEFTEELLKTTAVRIPADVLKHLPFRCYYLDLEELSDFAPTIGLFLYVGFDKSRGNLPNLGVLEVAPPALGDDQNQLRPILFSGKDLKREGLLEETEDGWAITFRQKNETDHDQKLLLFLLQGMLYLSSLKPDVEESPKLRVVNIGKKEKKLQKGKLRLDDVGVRYGNVIRKQKKEVRTVYIREGEQLPKQKRTVSSHVRSAHWHHYWTGKGRTKRIVKWIPPVFVSGNGKELLVTIHKVKGE